ncbi:MAG TPA: GspE/PulE family protein [Ignavibacteriaceae bacterium]|nr:GspE/PulE family protein [Ignavibacteriaceae bacterium]
MDCEILEIGTELVQTLTSDQAWHYHILPKVCDGDHLVFYHDNENDSVSTREELEILFGKKVLLQNISSLVIKKNLSKYYLRNNNSGPTVNSNSSQAKSHDFILDIIEEANNLLCSDIHIEAYENGSRIRFRMDGKLFERYIIKKEDYPALINKIKILANLDIAEKRLPQDGRILIKSSRTSYDIRVSVIPSLFGEKIVLRLLRKSTTKIVISELGFEESQLSGYLKGIHKPNGILLISGPTGSGKTTTLYATLNILNKEDVNILTIEDPIEYTIEGVNQVQLREDIGLTFARALKTFLRQDPDIIMLGEIRDPETAQMAIRAALTGHLVLSTIHTNSAWGIITRLIDMGIPPFLLSSTINTVVAQRLVRRLCPHCKEKIELDRTLLSVDIVDKIKAQQHFLAKGCEQCHNTGYSGRLAIFEVINIDEKLKQLIHKSQYDIKDLIKEKRIKTLSESALEVYVSGMTSLEEIQPILLDAS